MEKHLDEDLLPRTGTTAVRGRALAQIYMSLQAPAREAFHRLMNDKRTYVEPVLSVLVWVAICVHCCSPARARWRGKICSVQEHLHQYLTARTDKSPAGIEAFKAIEARLALLPDPSNVRLASLPLGHIRDGCVLTIPVGSGCRVPRWTTWRRWPDSRIRRSSRNWPCWRRPSRPTPRSSRLVYVGRTNRLCGGGGGGGGGGRWRGC